MKISVIVALIMAPVLAMALVGCATSDGDAVVPNYPAPNRADHAAQLQDAHSKYIRNQY